MKFGLFISAALVGAVLAGSVSASTILINGSFEQGTGIGSANRTAFGNLGQPGSSSWDIYGGTNVTGWTAGTNGVEIQTSGTLRVGGAAFNAQDGRNYVELDTRRNSSMSQTVFLSGGRYTLSFYYSPRVNTTEQGPTTNAVAYGLIGAGGTVFSLMADGPSGGVPFGRWTRFNHTFDATQGNYGLFFAAAGNGNGFGGLVDNVSITPVPLPAAGLLLLGAVGGMGLLRRRKGRTG